MRGNAARFLGGVGTLDVYATIGTAASPATLQRRHLTRTTLPEIVPCEGGCHGGGFELASDLQDRLISRMRSEGDGMVRCRGYREKGGRRQACDHALVYRAKLVFDGRF